ncbi:hypothetical protein BDN67DRAFT_918414 [Paxillus ammoniavirescens]|nr:hypothetical protein BDN67DRAFT_918414 [Paxillus ammoniavirescens]
MNQHIFSLYRTYVREVRKLPHIYLRQFFQIKGADDFRSVLQTKLDDLRKKKLKRMSKGLRKLQAANAGDHTAFDRMLDIAYGRVGKLRWELMEPLLSDPDAPPPAPIIPGKDKSVPPIYSPELTTLLTSGNSRRTKPLEKQHLVFPPRLPGRAKPDSEEAALLGPLSRRREFNIRWRYFKTEWKRVYPPLGVSEQHPTTDQGTNTFSMRPRNIGFQDTAVLQELLELAGSPSKSPGLTHRQRTQQESEEALDSSPFDGKLSARWLRRRYQALLGRLPLLTLRPPKDDRSKPVYDVLLADSAMTPSRPHTSRLRVVDTGDMSWICDVQLPDSFKGRRR